MPELVRRYFFSIVSHKPLAILTGSQLIVALAGLLYGKLTALYILPDVWGAYALSYAASTCLYSLLINPTLQSFKTSLSQYPNNQTIYFHSNLLWKTYLVLGVFVTLVGFYLSTPTIGFVWMALVGQGFYGLGTNYLNTRGKHGQYALLQIGYAIAPLFVLMFLAVGLHQRSTSDLWLILAITNTTFALISTYQLVHYIKKPTKNDTALRSTYQQYVWPLIGLAFWNWLLTYTDRYLIRIYLSEIDVGYYTMGYSLGSKVLLGVAPLLAFLSPQILQLRANGKTSAQANDLIRFYLIRYVALASFGCLFFYIARNWIGHLLLSDRYYPAFSVGPIVAAGYVFLTSIHLLELKWYAFGQTRFILWHNVVGTFLNIGLNLLLIPQLGLEGAALATLLGFAGQFLLAIWWFKYPKSNQA